MKVSDFDFELPQKLIARRPPPQRDDARMLLLAESGEACFDSMIRDIPQWVKPGDLWVLNDTRVIPARLLGEKRSGGKVEVLLLEPAGEADCWYAWGKANKPLKVGTEVIFSDHFSATVLAREGKQITVHLHADDVAAAIEAHGHMPLPPYIDRPDSAEDRARYQTVFARHSGAVAAPTAGLHLTEPLMAAMRDAGAEFVHITLHVGPGTFQPVQVDDVSNHVMHEEAYVISPEAAASVNAAKARGGRVVAVGTTTLRTLEAAAEGGMLQAGAGRTSIFIYPGYQLQIVDALLTNFHLPRSTLLMLVAALAGRERMLKAYDYAIAQQYRFYSYGDAMFIPKVL